MRLAEMQRAFHAAALGDGLAAGLLRDDGVAPAVRMHVYAHAYRARLHGVLAADFPRLCAALGADAFAALADRYLRAHPPRHPSIAEAGARLPGFLDGWPAALAALERARAEVFTAADEDALARAALATLPPAALAGFPLRPIAASRLLRLTHDADALWDGAPPRARACTVLVWRRGLEVVHRTLDDDEARALAALAGGGGTFVDACAALVDHSAPAERAIELLLRWIDAETLAASP